MKQSLTASLILLLFLPSCSPRHYHGCGFIQNPRFDQFGASYDHEKGRRVIKSYIRSEMRFRTEYIYENFDIIIPDTLITGKEYSVSDPGITVWYARGGQAGQIETTAAKGTVTVKDIDDDDDITLVLNLKFYAFTVTGGHLTGIPDRIERSGTLHGIKGYRLY